jgi:hypothetical protein
MRTVLVTPTYAPDFERCRLLVDSCQQYVSGVQRHLLLIDEAERDLFACLESDQVEILCKEQLLPWWIRRNPLSSRWWLSLASLPVRGWILQQVVKLAIAEQCDADALLFADSDMVFIRPFSPDDIRRGDKLRHYRAQRGPRMYSDRRYRNWYRVAASIAGLPDPDSIDGAYIAQLNCWRRENVEALYRALEQAALGSWQARLLRCLDFSEFVLYGAFVDYALGDASGHYRDPDNLCHSSWYYPIVNDTDVDRFISELDPRHHALHLQSNLGLNPELLSAFNLSL